MFRLLRSRLLRPRLLRLVGERRAREAEENAALVHAQAARELGHLRLRVLVLVDLVDHDDAPDDAADDGRVRRGERHHLVV